MGRRVGGQGGRGLKQKMKKRKRNDWKTVDSGVHRHVWHERRIRRNKGKRGKRETRKKRKEKHAGSNYSIKGTVQHLGKYNGLLSS